MRKLFMYLYVKLSMVPYVKKARCTVVYFLNFVLLKYITYSIMYLKK